MNINYSRNLQFQKEHFPQIYKSYLAMESEKTESQKINIKQSKYLYLLLDRSIDITQFIEKMFCVNYQYPYPFSLCEVRFGFDNTVFCSDSGRVIFEVNHPYLDYNKSLIISNDVDFKILKESFAFYTYNAGPFKQLTELKIKRCCDYEYESHNIKCREDFLKCVNDMKPVYTFLISSSSSQEEKFIQSFLQADEVSLIVIRKINEKILEKEDAILDECRKSILELLKMKGIEILYQYMKMGTFTNNFILVERFFSFEREFTYELNKYFKNEVLISIREFKRIKNDYSVRYNAISGDKRILELNSFMEMYLKKFCEILEDR